MSDIYLQLLGLVVLKRGHQFLVRYDTGESAGSREVEVEITETDVLEIQKGDKEAYRVLLRVDNNRRKN